MFERSGLRVESVVPELGQTVGAALLEPHRSYLSLIRPLLADGAIKGMAHITGGGITDNLPRILPEGTGAQIDRSSWDVPPLFRWLQQRGNVADDDMLRTFNMGIGLIVACAAGDAERLIDRLAAAGEPGAVTIGRVEAGRSGVRYVAQ